MTEIQEVYKEDTVGRKYFRPIINKKLADSIGSNGKVKTLKFNRPMPKSEFKNLNDDLKIIYLKYLRETYGATLTQVAEMLGYNVSYFSSKFVSRLKLKGLFKGHPSQEQAARWEEFLQNGNPEKQKKTEEAVVCPEPPSASFCDCSFTLKGGLKTSDIVKRVQAMVDEGTPCIISVSVSALNGR